MTGREIAFGPSFQGRQVSNHLKLKVFKVHK